MKINFRELANTAISTLTPYQPSKPIEELERELGITSSIKLAGNENPLGPSPKAILAAAEALQKGNIYPDGNYYSFKQALAHFLSVKPEQLTIGNGSENILELIIKSYLCKHDEAIISQYAFLTIPILLQSYGARSIVVPAHNWGHDIFAMTKAINHKTRVLFLVNPNNPTGTYTTVDEFRRLLEAVPPHILIVIDEAYFEYISTPDYPNGLTFLQDYPNLVITRTFSKAYGLAALRLGYAVSSPEIADILNRARLPFNVNTPAAKAGCAALADQEHVQKSFRFNQVGMQQLEIGLQKLNLSYIPSIANFITVNVGNGVAVYQELLTKGVIVRPLQSYGMPQHIRVTIGTPEEIERFVETMANIV
jgi:histidinol-phosphate aminotransferase